MQRPALSSPVTAGLLLGAVCLPVALTSTGTAAGTALVTVGGGLGGYLGQRWAVRRKS